MENKNLTKTKQKDKEILTDWERTILEELNKKELKELENNENKNS